MCCKITKQCHSQRYSRGWTSLGHLLIFRKYSIRNGLNNFHLLLDPGMWNEHHVKLWIQWAVKEFNLTGVDVSQFNLTGKELCDLQHEVSKRNLRFLMPVTNFTQTLLIK